LAAGATRPRQRTIARSTGIALLCWAILATLFWAGVFTTTDLRLLDLRFRIRGERPASDALALVEIDDATIRTYGQWPLTRDVYALLLNSLADAGARAVGVDLVFADRDTDNPRADMLLAAVSARSPGICHAVSFLNEPESQSARRPDAPTLDLLAKHAVAGDGVVAPSAGGALLPYPELLVSTHTLGHIAVAVDRDSGVRRVPLLVRYEGRLYPALGLSLAALAGGDGTMPTAEQRPGGVSLAWPDGRRLEIPVDPEGATAIDFAGDRSAFRNTYSLLDVLGWVRAGRGDELRRAFSGQIVLVGSTALAEAATDADATPFSITTPLVYVHANTVDAILSERFLRSPSAAAYLAALAALAVLFGWIFVALPFRRAVAAMVCALVATAAVVYGVFVLWRVDIPPSLPFLLPVVVYLSVETYRSVFMERTAREREKELAMARTVQSRLFPSTLPEAEGWEFAGLCEPAKEVGGDYYDLIGVNGGLVAVALGDVSGKGLGPSILMSNVHAMLRSCLRRPGAEPAEIVTELNEHLNETAPASMFITLFVGILDVETGAFRYVNGGHNPGVVLSPGVGDPVFLEKGGLVVGAMPGVAYEQGETSIAPGSMLVLYSDGVTEAFDERGEMFGDERLLEILASAGDLSPNAVIRRVVSAVERFRGRAEPSDDLSVVVVRRLA